MGEINGIILEVLIDALASPDTAELHPLERDHVLPVQRRVLLFFT